MTIKDFVCFCSGKVIVEDENEERVLHQFNHGYTGSVPDDVANMIVKKCYAEDDTLFVTAAQNNSGLAGTMTIRDLVRMEIDIDVYDDVCEELSIAFCGPQPLTPAGQEHFAGIMDYPVTIVNNGSSTVAIVHVDDPDEAVWTARLAKAKEFFDSAAGYCPCSLYDKWFGPEGDGKEART